RVYPSSLVNPDFDQVPQFAYVQVSGPAGTPYCVVATGLQSCTSYKIAVRPVFDCAVPGLQATVTNTTRCSGNVEVYCLGDELHATSTDLESIPATRLALGRPSPNPSMGDLRVDLTVPSSLGGTTVTVALFDIAGRQRGVLYDGPAIAG